MRDNIILYKSLFEALDEVEPALYKEVMQTVYRYAMNDEQPACTGTALALFKVVKPLIDSNNKKYECGKMGGRPRKEKPFNNQTETNQKPNHNQTETILEPNHNLKDKSKKIKDKSEMLKDNSEKINDNSEMLKEKSEMLKDNKNTLSDKSDSVRTYPYADVITYLNEKAGTAFKVNSKDTRKHIRARCDEGFTVDDFKTVIDRKVTEWGNNPDMAQYLRPSTLFGTKFESYLNQKVVKPSQVKSKNKFCNFPQREYDWDNLEAEMLKNGSGEA